MGHQVFHFGVPSGASMDSSGGGCPQIRAVCPGASVVKPCPQFRQAWRSVHYPEKLPAREDWIKGLMRVCVYIYTETHHVVNTHFFSFFPVVLSVVSQFFQCLFSCFPIVFSFFSFQSASLKRCPYAILVLCCSDNTRGIIKVNTRRKLKKTEQKNN